MIKSKKVIILILSLFLALTLLGSAVFAYFEELQKGWETQIHLTSIQFYLNGKPKGTKLDSALLTENKLEKGQFFDTNLELKATSSTYTASEAQYTIKFTYEGADNELARAMEVYEKVGNEYIFIDRLSNLVDTGYTFSGVTAVNLGTNVSNTVQRDLRLVYSESAGDYYNDKSFIIKATAEFTIVKNVADKYFVRDEKELISAQTGAVGKTICLLKDITLTKDFTSSGKMGLDLNGNNLNLNNHAFNISYTGNGSDKINLGLNNSKATGAVTGGKITLDTLNDCMYVGDSIKSFVTVAHYSLSVFADKVKANAIKYDNALIGVTGKLTSINIAQNLSIYLPTATMTLNGVLSQYLDFVGGVLTVKATFSPTLTYAYSGYISINNTGISEPFGIAVNLRICGTSAYSSALAILDSVPDEINGSVFLSELSQYNDATISWYTSNEQLLTSNGAYLPSGRDILTTWDDTSLIIGAVASVGGNTARATKSVTIKIADAKERTEFAYKYPQYVLKDEKEPITFASFVFADKAIKAKLSTVVAEYVTPSENLNTIGESYSKITLDTQGNSVITLLKRPDGNPVKINLRLTFTYKNGNADITYQLNTFVMVINPSTSTEWSDATGKLQQLFDYNRYIKNGEFVFYVNGSVNGCNVEFSTNDEYIFIDNGIYTQDNTIFTTDDTRNYVKIGNVYHYFSTERYTYDSVSGSYKLDASGAYIYANKTYLLLSNYTNSLYKRVSKVTLLPTKIPSYDVISSISAKMWIYDINGNKQYITQPDGADLTYNLKMQISGIYHNIATEIADGIVYSTMKNYYDINNNGYIEVREAQTEWFSNRGATNEKLLLRIKPTSIEYTKGKELYYINLSSSEISSLKGIEYFTYALGFDFSNNSLVNLTPLSRLYRMKYLNLSANAITSLSGLGYLDEMVYLDLSSNNITDIEEIKYLRKVEMLYLQQNNNLADISPLKEYKSLYFLNVVQKGNANTNSKSFYYSLVLIYANNFSSHGVQIMSVEGAIKGLSPTYEEQVATLALEEMTMVRNISTTLYTPDTYKFTFFDGTWDTSFTYYLKWSAPNNEDNNYLTFSYDNSTHSNTCVIINPVVDRYLTISVQVGILVGSNMQWYESMSRSFYVRLLSISTKGSYIQTSATSTISAVDAIPDENLRSALFDKYNLNKTGSITINGVPYNNSDILTTDELNPPYKSDLNLNNLGITNLSGIEYFATALSGMKLYLENNSLTNEEISKLKALTNISEITIGGGKYDFTYLLNKSASGVYSSPFTSLHILRVSSAYDLDKDDVIAGLYQVFLKNKSVDIYIKSNEIWNPYKDISRKASSLPTVFAFYYLGQTQSISSAFTMNFYGVDITFNAKSLDYFTRSNVANTASVYFDTVTEGGLVKSIKYKRLVAVDETFYIKVSLFGSDERGVDNITYEHFMQLTMESNSDIYVNDVLSNNIPTSIKDIFTGTKLRTIVMEDLSYLITTTASATSVNNIGSGYYLDASTNKIYVSRATLATLASSYNGKEVTIDGMHLDSGTALSGLQYLPNITKLFIFRDVQVGDGSELINIVELQITESGIDLTTITKDLPAMKKLTIGKTVTFQDNTWNRYAKLYSLNGNTYNFALSHFTGLNTLYMVDTQMYDWTGLYGLLGNVNFTNLKIYATSAEPNTFTNHTNKNTNVSTGITTAGNYKAWGAVEIIKAIFNSTATVKNFYIGDPLDSTNKDYKFTADWKPVETIKEYSPIALADYKELNSYILDTGLQVTRGATTDYYFNNRNDEVNVGDTIRLPGNTSGLSLGTNYGDDTKFGRQFAIRWRVGGVANVGTLNSLFTLTLGTTTTVGVFPTITSLANIGNYNVSQLNNVYDGYKLTVKTQSADYYLLLIGTVGEGYFAYNNTTKAYDFIAFQTSAVKTKTFIYPILVRANNTAYTNGTTTISVGADNYGVNTFSYGNFPDKGLRFYMYCIMTNNCLRNGTYIHYGSILQSFMNPSASVTKNGSSVVANTAFLYVGKISSTGTSNLSYRHRRLNASGAVEYATTSDIGIDYKQFGTLQDRECESATALQSEVTNLTYISEFAFRDVKLNNNFISVLDGLYSAVGSNLLASNCKKLELANNIIYKVNVLSNFTALTVVDLSSNNIPSLLSNGTNIFVNSSTTLTLLNLSNNRQIDSDSITSLKDSNSPANSCNNLKNLYLYQTKSAGKYETLQAIDRICAVNGGSLTLTYYSGTEGIVTTAEIKGFIDVYSGSASPLSNILQSIAPTDKVNLSIISGNATYTATFLFAINNLGLEGNLSDKELVAPMRLTSSGSSQLFIDVSARYLASGTSNKRLNVRNLNGTYTYFESSDFDPGIWAYFMKTLNGNPQLVSTELIIDTNYGIRTLKGLEKIYLTKIDIKNNDIEGLWTYPNNKWLSNDKLTSFSLGIGSSSAVLTQDKLAVLYACKNLSSLNLSGVVGVDYLAPITVYDASGVATQTSLSKLIAKSAIASLTINNERPLDWYGGSTTIFGFLKKAIDSNNYIMGLTSAQADATCRKMSDSSSPTWYSVGNYYYGNTQNKNMSNVDNAYRISQMLVDSNQSKMGMRVDTFDNYFKPLWRYMSNIFTATDRISKLPVRTSDKDGGLLPSKISKADIETPTGITFNLPTSYTLYGQTINLLWSCPTNTAYVANNVLHLDSTNYVNKEKEIKLSVKFTYNYKYNGATTVATYEILPEQQYAISILSVPVNVAPNIKLPVYYIKLADQSTVLAESVISSANLIYYLFNDYTTLNKYTATVNGVSGWCFDATAVTELALNKTGVTSLKGVEKFINLKKLEITAGYITDLTPIANLNLTTFKYTSNDSDLVSISNFLPLITGSKDSLTIFEYADTAKVQIPDLSFLMGFTKLDVALFSANTQDAKQYLQYFNMPSFAYMVAWFNVYQPNVKILIKAGLNVPFQHKDVKYNETVYWSLIANNYTRTAVTLFNNYGDSVAKLGGAFTFSNNFLLSLNVGADTGNLYLPAFIDSGGKYYAIEYKAVGQALTLSDTYVISIKDGSTITLNGASISNGSIITYEQLRQLLTMRTFTQKYISGQITAQKKVSVVTAKQCKLTCRIEMDGYKYERMLFVKL